MSKKKILLVDSARSFVGLGNGLLRRTGAEVISAPLGADAWKKVTTEHPDLIMTDLVLPDMAGTDLCRKVKASPRTANTPVVIVLASGGSQEAQDCKRAGADAVLTRPILQQDLLNAIAALLGVPYRQRARFLTAVTTEVSNKREMFFVNSVDLSSCGMLIETRRWFTIGDRLAVRFFLPHGVEISARGRVVRIQEERSPIHRYGLQFEDLSLIDQKQIDRLIESRAIRSFQMSMAAS